MRFLKKTALLASLTVFVVPSELLAQEVCFTDANKKLNAWIDKNGATLNELSRRYEASEDPYKELIQYKGMQMPIAAALIIEGERYGQLADAQVASSVSFARDCAKQTGLPRSTYDFARDILGITTVLPEKATRIDFEELRRGNIAGGKKSVVRESGRAIDKIFNPFRW